MATPRTVRAADGLELAVHDLGGRGPILLLAHATGYCGLTWEPVAERLRESFHCIAPDCRAHGASGRPPTAAGFSWTQVGSDVIAVSEALGHPSPLFGAGHSAGATGLVLGEVERPGTFAGLWCYEPVLFPMPSEDEGDDEGDEGGNPMAEAARQRRSEFADRAEAEAHYANREPFSRFAASSFHAFLRCGLVEDESGEGLRLAARPEDESRFYEMGGFEDAWGAAEAVDCPVTFATGDQPGAFGMGHAELLAGRLSYGQAELLAGLSHFGPLEDPAEVAASILDALGG